MIMLLIIVMFNVSSMVFASNFSMPNFATSCSGLYPEEQDIRLWMSN